MRARSRIVCLLCAAFVFRGEWTGVWEDELVRVVVPWVDAHPPTIRSRASRTLAGLSAGGYGAVDIGFRHPRAQLPDALAMPS